MKITLYTSNESLYKDYINKEQRVTTMTTQHNVPPASIKATVDAIATARKVTLYKGSK